MSDMTPERDTRAAAATAIPLPAGLPAGDRGLRIDPSLDPYTAILELAEYELQLARDGRIEDLRSLARSGTRSPRTCPSSRPSRHVVRWNARRLCMSVRAPHLQCLREGLLCDLRTTARASRAAHGYAGQAPRRVHRMDHSA